MRYGCEGSAQGLEIAESGDEVLASVSSVSKVQDFPPMG